MKAGAHNNGETTLVRDPGEQLEGQLISHMSYSKLFNLPYPSFLLWKLGVQSRWPLRFITLKLILQFCP